VSSVLQGSRPFDTWKLNYVKSLARQTRTLQVKAGTIVMKPEDAGQFFIMVVSGTFRMYSRVKKVIRRRIPLNKDEVVMQEEKMYSTSRVRTVGAGAYFGHAAILGMESGRDESFGALTDGEVLMIRADEFRHHVKGPALQYFRDAVTAQQEELKKQEERDGRSVRTLPQWRRYKQDLVADALTAPTHGWPQRKVATRRFQQWEDYIGDGSDAHEVAAQIAAEEACEEEVSTAAYKRKPAPPSTEEWRKEREKRLEMPPLTADITFESIVPK